MNSHDRDRAAIGGVRMGTITIPYTELPPMHDGPFATEWNHYRSVVGELLAAGHEGK